MSGIISCEDNFEDRLVGFNGRHLVSIDDFSRRELEYIVSKSLEFKALWQDRDERMALRGSLCDEVGSLIFLEPSTRTFGSFRRAGVWLGADVPEDLKDPSNTSFVKNESVADALRNLVEQHDLSYLIIRSKTEGMARHAAKVLDKYTRAHNLRHVSVFNAGDGRHEHPTQAILDMMTIKEKHDRLDNLKIVLQGDLENSRTIHSLLKVLLRYENNEYWLLSDPAFAMPTVYKDMIKSAGARFNEVESYSRGILDGKDVIYLSRPQAERFNQKISDTKKEEYIKKLTLLEIHLPSSHRCPIIMHALPIDETFGEVEECVKDHPNFIAFKQAGNGTYSRATELLLFKGAKGWGDELPEYHEPREDCGELKIRSDAVHYDQEKLRHHIIGPIKEGWVIDRIPPVRDLYFRILSMLPDRAQGDGEHEFNGLVRSMKDGSLKYLIKRSGFKVPMETLNRIMSLSDKIVVHKIEDRGDTVGYLGKDNQLSRREVGVCTEKMHALMPKLVKDLYECPNIACVSRLKNVQSEFALVDPSSGIYRCVYDDTPIKAHEAKLR